MIDHRALILIPTVLLGFAFAAVAEAQPVQKETVNIAVTGEVTEIDAKARTLTIREASGESSVYQIDEKTTIMSGSQKVGFDSLHEGEWIVIDANPRAGSKVATYVEVMDDPATPAVSAPAKPLPTPAVSAPAKPLPTPAVSAPAKPLPTPAGAKITVGHNKLEPSLVKIGAGQSVTFHNVDKMPGGHTVVADDGSFSSPALDKDQSWSHSFDDSGVYPVHIEQHPSATARIVVE
jgi:plastocyanin